MITISESTPVTKFCSHQPGQPAEITRDEIMDFVKAASQRHTDRLRATYPTCDLNWETLDIQFGKKYARIVTVAPDGMVRSAFGFIEIATGNLLKTAGWSAPAKGVRGNIRLGDASNGWNGAVGDHGMAYLR
jgi:hypothetical protein